MTVKKAIVLLLLSVLLAGQQNDSIVVKYFPTELTRGMILDQAIPAANVAGESHFKAYYSPQGDLISVEYIPDPADRSDRKVHPSALRSPQQYFTVWNPWQRKLSRPLDTKELAGKRHYGARFSKSGHIKQIDCFNSSGKQQWTYFIRWNRAHSRSVYEVEFQVPQPLTLLDKFLFVPELSEMRPGWIARFKLRKDGRPKLVKIHDQLEQLMYFYKFGYGKDGREHFITSAYFRADSSLVGRHELFFDRGSKQPDRIVYFSRNKQVLKTVTYDWSSAPGQVTITEHDGNGRLVSRRVRKIGSQ